MLNQKGAEASLDKVTNIEYVIDASEKNAKGLQLFLALLAT